VKYATKVTKALVIALISGSLIAACASAPKRVAELEQARVDVQTLQQDPLAQQEASQELANARSSLEQADAAMTKGDQKQVLHYAYLASQQAKTGQEKVTEAHAKQQVAQGEADRNRVLLEARTREAESATEQARAQTQQAEASKQEALAAKAEAEDTQRQLAELQAKQTERGMVLTLGDVLFDTGKATLKPGAESGLVRVAQFLQKNPGTKVIIEGHTDSRGSDEYNQELSQRRAQAVSDALASRGVDRGRVEPVGRGKALPVASNATAVGQQQNRRVEIIFSDESGRFASDSNASLR
jgi:outer membrane protein OmpA-like peptidoglycan-associated protein